MARKADLRQNHTALDASLRRYREFAAKVVSAQRVIGTDIEKRDLAESILLRVCACWERFVDEHIVDCVNRYHARLSDYFQVQIPHNPTWDLCHALIIGRSYRDFRSVGELIGFSRQILPDNRNPFEHIAQPDRDRIDRAFTIRNYLSHYSSASRRALRNMYRTHYQMTTFREPGGFLLVNAGERLLDFISGFQNASAAMAASL